MHQVFHHHIILAALVVGVALVAISANHRTEYRGEGSRGLYQPVGNIGPIVNSVVVSFK